MMIECSLILPYPPSVNHYKKVGQIVRTKKGKLYQKRYNSPETQAYYYQVWMLVRQERLKSFAGATISMQIEVCPPDKRKRDLDGILKVLLDSLQHAGLYDCDSQIARLLVIRKDIIKYGQLIVKVKDISS
jgi:crossover junction endodeoxyribonuclease RusA